MILGFDTSGGYCGAALLSEGEVIAAAHEEMRRGQAERLFPMLEEILRDADIGWRDLSTIGVGIGPGNFTGIRISVSAARGLGLSLQIPAIGVSIMEAASYGTEGAHLIAMAAPRDTAYLQGFNGAWPIDLTQHPVSDLANTSVGEARLVIGSAAEAVAETLNLPVAPARYAPAPAIARIAALRDGSTADRPIPLYVRDADAAPPSDPPPVIVP